MAKPDDVLEFVDDEAVGAVRDPGVLDASCSILEIVWETILSKFGSNYRTIRACWVDIMKDNKHIDKEFKLKMQNTYKIKKTENKAIFD